MSNEELAGLQRDMGRVEGRVTAVETSRVETIKAIDRVHTRLDDVLVAVGAVDMKVAKLPCTVHAEKIKNNTDDLRAVGKTARRWSIGTGAGAGATLAGIFEGVKEYLSRGGG